MDLLCAFPVQSVTMAEGGKATVVFSQPKDMDLAANAFNNREIHGNVIAVHRKPLMDCGFDLSLASGNTFSTEDIVKVKEALHQAHFSTKAVTLHSNTNAFVSFLKATDVSIYIYIYFFF